MPPCCSAGKLNKSSIQGSSVQNLFYPPYLHKGNFFSCYSIKLQGITVIPYLDDYLLIAASENAIKERIDFLDILGWIVNWDKSDIVLPNIKKFLGLIIDSQKKLYLPSDKKDKI